MRVLHVTQSTGGVGAVVSSLVADQIARGWRVSVACPPDIDLAAAASAAGARVYSWHASRSPTIATVAESVRLHRIVAAARPDVVHLHSSKAGLVGRLVVRRRIPTVFEPHLWSFDAQPGVTEVPARLWERLAVRWTDRVLCVSDDERTAGERAGIDADYSVIDNGVDLQRFRPADRAAARARLRLDDAPIALCLARLAPLKGQDYLLDAWPGVLARVPDARLLFVGDGPAAAVLREHPMSADPSVTWLPHADDPRDLFAAADVLVAPSRAEGMALTPIEAMASGRPVVGFAANGMRHAVGAAGEVLPIGDVSGLAAAVARRLADPRLAAREGCVGRRRALALFDAEASSARVADVLEEVAGHGAVERGPAC